MEQPKEGAARKDAPEGVSTKTATALRSGRAQVDADLAVRASQHEEGGARDSVHTNDTAQLKAGGQDKIGTIEEGTTPSRAEGSRKEASTETTQVERYEALAAKLRVSSNAVNKVEIEYEVRLMFTALYNGMRILEQPKKANDNYPTLNGEEADALVDLFRLLAIEKGKSFPEWKRTIQDLCKDMHRSSWTVVALIQKRIDQNKLAEETKASPWGSQTSTNSQTKAKEQGTQPFTFKSDKYSEEEQSNMIRHCKQKFEYSVTLRQPTTMEWEIMLAIVEGELLIRHLPQFLRRVCDGDTLFRFQNTIAAQVEEELVGKLSDATQVYKDHQSTGRIVEAILQAARYRNDGKMEETMAMLKDLKAAEYNDSTHSLHFYFFDRSTAAKWNKMTIPFRRQLVQLISAHQTETTGERQEANNVWNRQLGADGLQNAESRSRYKIQLLNTARSMNMALFLEYLKQTTGKRFYAYPLDQYVGTGISGQQIGNLKEQAKAKPNGAAANTKGPASKASQKNGPNQISKEDIRWAKELMRFRRDMDELMKVHVERQAELNPNRNDIMDWDGEYTLQDVMEANGLAEATTPPTGNCQFYAVAEAMLQITHDNMANEKLLEATASRIKQSMNAAARLNFDLEFPEGTHLGILEALGRGDRKMSPKERKADVLDYFNDIASSSSSRSSTLPGSMWGGPESLRMAAKALQRKVFVLIETTYRNRKGFAIYKPQSRVHAGGQFLSAKEHACTGKQWEDELRQDRIEAETTSSPLPIVMKFAKEHYNSLHFRTLNEPSSPANMTSSSLAKHLQGSERSKTEFKTDRSGQFDFEPVAEDSMEESDDSSLEDLEVAPSLDEREKFEPNQLSGHHGWLFASQENQLVVYHSPTTELPPQPRKRDRDETLMLTAGDGDNAMNLNSLNVPLKKTRTLSRRLAIEGDSMQKRRDLERTLQEHWEGFQEQWKQETKCPFPLLSSNHNVWTQAALNEWERILAMLKTSPGPHHVLNHLRGPTLVDLTQVLREQVIEEGLKRLLYRTDEAETKVWITGWFDRIATATTKEQRAALLNSKEDWSMLGRMKYGGLEVLRLLVYEEELQTFRSSDAEDPDNLYEAIEDFCAILKQTRELKAAFKSGEELSEWSALSVIMAQVTMEVDSVEPSRITTAKEERRLRQYWNRIWGITNLDEATSFWSIHPDATGGVAILTNPKTISETKLIEESKWTNRTVAIKSKGVVWINVYAPNKKSEREHFFRRLNEEFGTHRAAAVLGGDFNCVLDKQRDRKSGKRRAMGAHRATQALLGSPSSGAAYEMDEPTAETKEGEQVQAISRELELMQSEGPIEWSHLEKRIIQAILRVSRAEKRQVRRYQQKLEDQQHQPVKRSRRQLIEEQANAAREAAEFKFGKYMQATQGDVRHFFRRIANWQRDQTISRLEPTPGRYHPPNASLADIMGAEWHQITGQSHAAVPPHKAGQRFDALVYIPETRKVTEAQNQDLMAPITEKEVREAIAALHRHKAGGVDSLNNDFYKDCEDVMVDVLVREFNNIQRGAPMPRSFGQGIVIPLRKKGDSPNPLDYRPITLLTTTYKLFAKVLATRLQDILLWIIGEEQQGFVRDRLMENAILIMQAALDKAYHSSTEGFDDAPGIVMLDFMKAYDTLDRDFLYLVLSKFGFGRQFADLVRRMHTDTTAQYLVNGELSREWEVKSGIRRGCPLAPLLFIVAAEILALAVQQDPYLDGIRVTRSGAEPHLISTFVDDSAVFLKQGRQLLRLMQLLSEFGQQSGLHVQPTKSSYICLNTAVVQEQRCGIPILKHGETVRYLGIQIGTGNITQANWEDRLQKLRTRLIIATKVSNSVVGRVLMLNSVMLPSILFTAGYIKPPAKVVDQLVNLQKQFLWQSTLGTDGTRHKVSPSLLYLPVKEGGIGLYSIPLAIKRQAMRRTTRWLQRARDRYTEAWHEQVHQDKSQNWGCCAISPKERSQHAQTRLYQTNNIHRLGWEYLGEDLVAAEGRNPAWKDELKRQMESLLPTVDLEWRSDGRVGVYFGRKPEQTIHQLSEETRAFWPSFQWNDNPWIIDSQGGQYTV
ncbi:Rxlr effector protein, partial [Globisporangium splendens]